MAAPGLRHVQPGHGLKWCGARSPSGDLETCISYRNLLPPGTRINLHPCYLANWSSESAERETIETKRIFLYLGEAKDSKGFNLLPQFIENNIHLLTAEDRFVVQFTHTWENADIESTIVWLETFATTDSRLEVHRNFWDNSKLMHELRKATFAVFLYDRRAYRSKSSGFVWLTAWFRIPIAVIGESWLSREAKRLGQAVIELDRLALKPALDLTDSMLHVCQETAPPSGGDTGYRSEIFKPFWSWIDQLEMTGEILANA